MQDDDSRLERILSRALRVNNCLLWQGSINNDGYGTITYKNRQWKTHRLVYFLTHKSIENSVLHTCDVRNCIEISHLFDGTQDDNMKDASSKERLVKGENHPKAVLDQDKVDYIRSFYKEGKAPYGTRKRLARELSVSYWTIDQVLRYITWK
jgi:hypothetical protein